MQSKNIVFVTGAGFSVPAKLPVQNRIINEITAYPEKSLLEETIEASGSTKFLTAYIDVGLYLLMEYFGYDISAINQEYLSVLEKSLVREDEKYNMLLPIKESARKILENEIKKGKSICLEDLFTLIDKAIVLKEKINSYSYPHLDKLKNSIMRLFIYYFELNTKKHSFNCKDYINVINYLKGSKEGITFITTNWDTLFEKYLERNKMKIDFCLNKPYYSLEGLKLRRPSGKEIKYIKIHGSLNWFRCLSCGTLLIKKKDEVSNFVFENNAPEQCSKCSAKADGNAIQLQPEIITPTMIKAFSSQLYLNLWKAAYDELSIADEIIFIGYSLPIADFEFRHLLKKSIKKEAIIKVLLWKADNPSIIGQKTKNKDFLISLLPEQRYKDLFGCNKMEFFYNGFGKFFL